MSRGIRQACIGHDVTELTKDHCDVRSKWRVGAALRKYKPDWIVNCAGISDNTDPGAEVWTNLIGSINVATEARQTPTILIASVAGLYGKPDHLGYSASKAGVISVVQSLAFSQPIWAISPGRVDTPMRERDYPDDKPGSRLHAYQVGKVVKDIIDGKWGRGSNIVIRKIGFDSVKTEVHLGDGWREKLRVGLPKTI
jgi:NAD(P)-dependent dehydrogenase (short-subunit alcohol dehydrogenase family)